VNLSKTLVESILLDAASFLVLVSAFLYVNGLLFATGNMSGYGITNDLLLIGFRDSLFYGFAALFFSPFISTAAWVLSITGLIPVLLIKYKQQIPVVVVYCGMLFFLILQLAASYDTGEQLGKSEMLEIESTYQGKTPADFENILLKLIVNKPDNSIEVIAGYSLDIPGDYFVIVQKNKIVAIRKSDVAKVITHLNRGEITQTSSVPLE